MTDPLIPLSTPRRTAIQTLIVILVFCGFGGYATHALAQSADQSGGDPQPALDSLFVPPSSTPARLPPAETAFDVQESLNDLQSNVGVIRKEVQRIQTLSEHLDTLDARINTLESRLTELETGSSAPVLLEGSSRTSSTQQPSSPAQATVPAQAAEQDYKEALALLQNRRFDAAQEAFERFIRLHPDADLASNARYWLGETFYAQNQYDSAAAVFATALENDEQSSKKNDILLKLALTLKALQRSDEACLPLKALLADDLDPPVYIRDRAQAEHQALGCSSLDP